MLNDKSPEPVKKPTYQIKDNKPKKPVKKEAKIEVDMSTSIMSLKEDIVKTVGLLADSEEYNTLNGGDNIWILKPGALSRGRGIKCIKTLSQVLEHIDHKESKWVVQKYIENPLLILRRKFDVRLWVLVTSINPLRIWNYDSPYVRFSCKTYAVDDLDNNLVHLTNNAVSKKSKHKKELIEGNMWFLE